MVDFSVTASGSTEKFTGEVVGGDTWTHAKLTRTVSRSVTETLKVITDIAPPTPKEIGKELTAGSLTIADLSTAGEGFVMPTNVPTGQETLTYASTEKFAGSYRGIAGNYECPNGCTVATDSDGDLVLTGTGVNFVPDSVADTYDDPDTAYLVFGAWKQQTKASDGSLSYLVIPYGYSIGVAPTTAPTDLEGTATYKGEAAGAFATKTFTAGALTDANAGVFAATVTLEADFDATGDGAGTAGSIKGTVDNFMNDGGVDSSDWEVSLGSAELDGDGTVTGGQTSVTFGGPDNDNAGYWEGRWFGPSEETEAADQYPGMVVGTFDAHTNGAQLSGGFGAHLEE